MSFHSSDPSVLAKNIHSMPAGAPTASLKLASGFSQLTNPFIMTLTSKLALCTIPTQPATLLLAQVMVLSWIACSSNGWAHVRGKSAPDGPECGTFSLQPTEAGPRHPAVNRAPMATGSCPHQVQVTFSCLPSTGWISSLIVNDYVQASASSRT